VPPYVALQQAKRALSKEGVSYFTANPLLWITTVNAYGEQIFSVSPAEADDATDVRWGRVWAITGNSAIGAMQHLLSGFLTTDADAIVKPIHPKAMPVILRTEAEIERWLTAPAAEALELRRPLPDKVLQIVAECE
jgi:hypothetical protein